MTPGAVAERATHIAAVRADDVANAALVRTALVAVREITAWAAAQQAGLIAQLSTQESCPETSIAAASKESLASASKAKERSDTLAATPRLAESLDNGAITPGHIDALTRASKQLTGTQRNELFTRIDSLTGAAEAFNIDQFATRIKLEVKRMHTDDGMDRFQRQRRNTRLRTWTDDDGMYCLHGRFDPITGVALHGRLDNAVQALFAQAVPDQCPDDPVEKQRFLTAHALVQLALGTAVSFGAGANSPGRDRSGKSETDRAATSTRPSDAAADDAFRPRGASSGAGRPEYIVVIDADADDYPGPVTEWPIPIEVPTRVLAELVADTTVNVNTVVVRNGIVLHAPGNLNLGRTTRLANRAQRRALRGLYRHCAMPGCTTTYDRCKLHHITWWRHGGTTDLDNLIPVCTKHHGNIHNDHWNITLGPNRQLTLTLPDGTIHNTGPPNRNTA